MIADELKRAVTIGLETGDFSEISCFASRLRLTDSEEFYEIRDLHDEALNALANKQLATAQLLGGRILRLLLESRRRPEGKTEALIELIVLLS